MKEDKRNVLKAVGSAGSGAIAGAGAYGLVGGIGVAVGGTAIGITAGPFIAIGSGLGLTGYGLYWLGKQIGRRDKNAKRG